MGTILFYGAYCDRKHCLTTGLTVVSSIVLEEMERENIVKKVNIADKGTGNREGAFFVINRTLQFMAIFLKLFFVLLCNRIDVVYYQPVYSKMGILRAYFALRIITLFKKSSAAKTVHHAFIGGLLEHTLSVTKLCNYYCTAYPMLKRDLLLTAAMCHDIGKVREISLFPVNDYTDEGQFLGHIVMGCEMIGTKAALIPGFPELLKQQLQHCILAHHGEFEYGSPKKPSIIEAVALNMADNTDAKMETFTELLGNITEPGWQGYNKFFETNIYQTKID